MAQADARGQRQRQPLRPQARRRRRLHQHHPERAARSCSPARSRPAGSRSRSRTARLRIVREGTSRKFIDAVEQITFSGGYAAETGQPVLYVTERCVFRRTPAGMELAEVAPGIDIERDILAHMGFRPIVGAIRSRWTRASSATEPMGLEQDAARPQPGRAHQLRRRAQHAVPQLRRACRSARSTTSSWSAASSSASAARSGARSHLVVNYDGFTLDPR